MTTPPAKAYSYIRFSTPEQAHGDSYRRQFEAAERYAAENNLILDDELELTDQGVSAYRSTNARRGALRRFRDAVEDGLVPSGSTLIVENLDRISRDTAWTAFGVLSELINAGITVVTLADRQVYSRESVGANPTQIIISLLAMVRAHEESETKSRRLKASWHNKRNKAHERPITARLPAWLYLDSRSNKIAVHADRASVVRRIFELAAAGHGQHSIASILNHEGVHPFGRATVWHRSYIAKLLTNPAVIGQFTPHTHDEVDGRKLRTPQETLEGYFPAIIDTKKFELINSRVSDRRAPSTQRTRPLRNLLASLGQCVSCGSTMTRVTKGSRKKSGRPYLVCTKAKQGQGCKYCAVPQETVEKTFWREAQFLVDSVPVRDPILRQELLNVDEALDDVERRIVNVSAAIEEGHTAGLIHRLNELEVEHQRFSTLRDLAIEKLDRSGPLLQHKLAELENAIYASPTDTCKLNALLRQLFERVVIDPAGSLAMHWRHGGVTTVPFSWGEFYRSTTFMKSEGSACYSSAFTDNAWPTA